MIARVLLVAVALAACLALCRGGTISAGAIGPIITPTYIAPTAPMTLRLVTAGSSSMFLQQCALQYALMRPDLRILVAVASTPDATKRSDAVAWATVAEGNADAAFVQFVPSAVQSAAYPDLVYLPAWSAAFSAVYNLPSAMQVPLTLTTQIVARIYTGNITM
jgi:ABC-type phosphate transport system substrate-binding protein